LPFELAESNFMTATSELPQFPVSPVNNPIA